MSHPSDTRSVAIVLGLVMLFTPSSIRAQERTAFSDIGLFEAVVDRLFQHSRRAVTTETIVRFALDVNRPEFQILFRPLNDRDFEVESWRLPHGAPSIWTQLGALVMARPSLTADEAATLIAIEHQAQVVRKGTALGRLLSEGAKLRIPVVGNGGLTLDGSEYRLEVTSGSKTLRLSLLGPRDASLSDDPIYRWMGQVIAAAERSVDPVITTGPLPAAR